MAEVEVPGGVVRVLASEGIDPGEEERRRTAERERLEDEIERAERKLANEGVRGEGAARGRRGGAAQARRAPRGAEAPGRMTFRQAEEYLLGLELFGMRFGLDRMHKLMTVLDLPQRRFESIHVVGTNGKSSTARFCAAILARHGLRTGSYTSPHLRSFRERIEVGESPVSEAAFAAAVERAAHAAALVDRTAAADDHVTQFEALTAAAYHELARQGVEVAVVEAGLGGRYDATSVIPSRVQVLTGIGLEHTRWLGPTDRGHRGGEARRRARRGRRWSRRPTSIPPPAWWPSASSGSAARDSCTPTRTPRRASTCAPRAHFQRGNFALAVAAAEAFLGHPAIRSNEGTRQQQGHVLLPKTLLDIFLICLRHDSQSDRLCFHSGAGLSRRAGAQDDIEKENRRNEGQPARVFCYKHHVTTNRSCGVGIIQTQ